MKIMKFEKPERSRTYFFESYRESESYYNVSEVRVSDDGSHYIKHKKGLTIVKPIWWKIEIDADNWSFAPNIENGKEKETI